MVGVENAAANYRKFNTDGGYEMGTGEFGETETLAQVGKKLFGKPVKGLDGELVSGQVSQELENLVEQVATSKNLSHQGETYKWLVKTLGEDNLFLKFARKLLRTT